MANEYRRLRARGSWATPVGRADLTRGEIGAGTVVYPKLRVGLDPSADTGYRALKHESAGLTG